MREPQTMKILKFSRFAAVALAGIGLFSLGVSAQAAPQTIDRLEAAVNSSMILKSDVNEFRRTIDLRSQLDPLFSGTTVAEKGKNASDSEIIDYLINEKVIASQFPVTDAEVEQEINSIQANNRITREQLKSALKEQGYAFSDYFELIRASLAKRSLIDRDIRTKVAISDDDVKNYFYNHYSTDSSAPLAYTVKIITVSPSNYKSASAAKEVASRALQRIKEGESFEEVAKSVSDDFTASSGGELGTLTEDEMSKDIRQELKKLKIGETSDVLGSADSRYFILKLVDVSSTRTKRFEQAKEEIRNQLAATEYQRQISLWLDRNKQDAFIRRAGEPSATGLSSR